jgi:RecA/RadA recombinase
MASIEDTLKRLNKTKKEEDKAVILGDTEIIRTTTSTGSPYLDYLTGGGFMNGGFNLEIASGGVGKSTIALLACKDTIERRKKIAVYFDGEKTLNESYFERTGLPKDMFIHRTGRNLEDMLDEAELFAQSEDVGIIIFDSIPIFVATAVEAKSAGENTIGNEAKRFTARMPIIEGFAGKRDICLLALTSYKLNPGSMGDPRVLPRGEWQKTMSNTTLDMIKKDILYDEDKNIIGHKIDVRIQKTKNSSYDKSVAYSVNFYNEGGFNQVDEYARLFLETGISEQRGAWIFYASKDREELKANGFAKFAEALKEDNETFEFLKNVLNGKI